MNWLKQIMNKSIGGTKVAQTLVVGVEGGHMVSSCQAVPSATLVKNILSVKGCNALVQWGPE